MVEDNIWCTAMQSKFGKEEGAWISKEGRGMG